MSIEYGAISNADQLAKFLGDRPEILYRHLRSGLRQIGAHHVSLHGRRQFGAFRGQAYPDKLQRRSGALANTLRGPRLEGRDLDSLKMRVSIGGTGRMGITVPYALIHEFGGTIRPTRAKYLTVPLPDILTPAGVVKRKYQIVPGARKTHGGARTFIWRNPKNGNLFVAIREGKRARLRLLYILKKSVDIKPRLGWFRVWREAAGVRNLVLQRSVDRAMAEGSVG